MTRKRVIFHIGLHKSASTYIQQFFLKNVGHLHKLNCLYPLAGRKNSNHFNVYAEVAGHSKFNPKIGGINEIMSEFKQSSCDTCIISSEFFTRLSQKKIGCLANAFDEFDVQVIMVLRNQVDLLQSSYVQQIKNGETREFSEWLEENIDLYLYKYDELINTWSNYFGSENIRAILYETSINPALSLLEVCGFDYSEMDKSFDDLPNKANKSLGLKTVLLMRALSELKKREAFHDIKSKTLFKSVNVVSKQLGWNDTKPAFMSVDEVERVIDYFKKYNDNLFSQMDFQSHEKYFKFSHKYREEPLIDFISSEDFSKFIISLVTMHVKE